MQTGEILKSEIPFPLDCDELARFGVEIETGERVYFPFGLPLNSTDFTRPDVLTADVIDLLRYLGSQPQGSNVVVVVDDPVNFENAGMDSSEARRQARLMGFKQKLICEALLDILSRGKSLTPRFDLHRSGGKISDPEFSREFREASISERVRMRTEFLEQHPQFGLESRPPVVLMSELVDRQRFDHFSQAIDALIQRSLASDDFELPEQFYCCVPSEKRPKRHKSKTLAELKSMQSRNPQSKAYDHALAAMGYVRNQLAYEFALGGTKSSHGGELAYDELAHRVRSSLDFSLPEAFQFVPLGCAQDANPYRVVSGRFTSQLLGAPASSLISAYLERLPLTHEESNHFKLERIKDHEVFILDFYRAIFNHVELLEGATLEEQIELRDAFLFQFSSELVATSDSAHFTPIFRWFFQRMRIFDVIRREQSVQDFSASKEDSFHWPARGDESAPLYFARVVHDLLFSDQGLLGANPDTTGFGRLALGFRDQIRPLNFSTPRGHWSVNSFDFYRNQGLS